MFVAVSVFRITCTVCYHASHRRIVITIVTTNQMLFSNSMPNLGALEDRESTLR
jgi:hypothetical protein